MLHQGIPVTMSPSLSPDAQSTLHSLLSSYLTSVLTFGRHWSSILKAPALDRGCIMAHIMCADYYTAVPSMTNALKHLACAERLRPSANVRELFMLDAFTACLEQGDLYRGYAKFTECYKQFPNDLFAVKRAQGCAFGLGRPALMLAATENSSSLVALADARYYHSLRAFSLEENRQYQAAMEAGQKALSIVPDDVWAVHAVAHALAGQCEAERGIAWLDVYRPIYADHMSFMFTHAYFHFGFFQLDRCEFDAVRDVYEEHIWVNHHDHEARKAAGKFLIDAEEKEKQANWEPNFDAINEAELPVFPNHNPFHSDDEMGAFNFLWKWELRRFKHEQDRKKAKNEQEKKISDVLAEFPQYYRDVFVYMKWPYPSTGGLYTLLVLHALCRSGYREEAKQLIDNIKETAKKHEDAMKQNKPIESHGQYDPRRSGEPRDEELYIRIYLPIALSVFAYYADSDDAHAKVEEIHNTLAPIFTDDVLVHGPNGEWTECEREYVRAIGGSGEQRSVIEEFWREIETRKRKGN